VPALGVQGGKRGGGGGALGPPSGGAGGRSPPRGGSGAAPSRKKFWADIFSPVSGRHIADILSSG
jgi:hypothetical protein